MRGCKALNSCKGRWSSFTPCGWRGEAGMSAAGGLARLFFHTSHTMPGSTALAGKPSHASKGCHFACPLQWEAVGKHCLWEPPLPLALVLARCGAYGMFPYCLCLGSHWVWPVGSIRHLACVPEGEYIPVGKTPSLFVYFWHSFCCYFVFLAPMFFAFRKLLSQPITSAFVPLLLEALWVGERFIWV